MAAIRLPLKGKAFFAALKGKAYLRSSYMRHRIERIRRRELRGDAEDRQSVRDGDAVVAVNIADNYIILCRNDELRGDAERGGAAAESKDLAFPFVILSVSEGS